MRGIRMGRIAGVEIALDWSWLIVLALFTGSLATGQFPRTVPGLSGIVYVGAGLLASLLLFASVLAHELGHALVARRYGVPVKDITLFIFGGVASMEREPRTPGAEFVIAVIGPIVSLLLGGVFWLLSLPLSGFSPIMFSILGYLGVANIALAVFNLMPGFPLDGGRVLRAILWKLTGNLQRATRGAARTGQALALLFILAGLWLFFIGDIAGGIWIGFIGWFLFSAAVAANRQILIESTFRGVTVRDLMQPTPITAPANISLQRLIDEYFLPLGLRAIPVVQAGQPVGMISLQEMRKVPREQWGDVPVGHAMMPIVLLRTVTPNQPIADVLPLLADSESGRLLVVENDMLVGMLSREAIVRALDIRRNLGVGGRVVRDSTQAGEQPSQSPTADQWPGNAPT